MRSPWTSARGEQGHMSTVCVDSRALSLSQIWIPMAHWTSHKPKTAQSQDLSISTGSQQRCHVYTMYSLTRALEYVFQCGPLIVHSAWPFHSSSSSLFPFTQLKPRQQCWLRALCIPLGWWRALSSVRSLRPGADRSFTSTSLSNTRLDVRQHPAKRSAGGSDKQSQLPTQTITHKHAHTHTQGREKRFKHFPVNFSSSIFYSPPTAGAHV